MTGTARRCSWPLVGGSVPAWLGHHAAPQYRALPVHAPMRARAHAPSRPMWPGVGHSEARDRGGAAGIAAHPASPPTPGWGLPTGGCGFLSLPGRRASLGAVH